MPVRSGPPCRDRAASIPVAGSAVHRVSRASHDYAGAIACMHCLNFVCLPRNGEGGSGSNRAYPYSPGYRRSRLLINLIGEIGIKAMNLNGFSDK